MQMLLKDFPGLFGIEIRRRFYRRYFGSMGEDVVIHQDFHARNIHNLFVGNGVHLGESCFIQAAGKVSIGENTIIGPGVKIWSQNHQFKDPTIPIKEQGYTFKEVIIGDDVWIGANAFIMPGAVIGKGAVISAGSLLGGKPIPPYKIVAGNPARIIGKREITGSKSNSQNRSEIPKIASNI